MKKDIQEVINDYVIDKFIKMKEDSAYYFLKGSVQLRHCKAYVYETSNYYILESYNTVVAFIDKSTGEKFDVLRYVYGYTATSAQHIAKFFSDYSDYKVSMYRYREV